MLVDRIRPVGAHRGTGRRATVEGEVQPGVDGRQAVIPSRIAAGELRPGQPGVAPVRPEDPVLDVVQRVPSPPELVGGAAEEPAPPTPRLLHRLAEAVGDGPLDQQRVVHVDPERQPLLATVELLERQPAKARRARLQPSVPLRLIHAPVVRPATFRVQRLGLERQRPASELLGQSPGVAGRPSRQRGRVAVERLPGNAERGVHQAVTQRPDEKRAVHAPCLLCLARGLLLRPRRGYAVPCSASGCRLPD